jgi:hypothetical protein
MPKGKTGPDRQYRCGFVADTHCLSRYGLIPPAFRLSAHAQPAAQFYAYLWECWSDFVDRCPPLDLLVLAGDLNEGENPTRRQAMDALTDDLLVQGEATVETLAPLVAKASQTVAVRGTAWHEGKHYETSERIARELGCVEWTPHRYTGYVLEADWCGLRLNVAHHQTTGAVYRGTLADRATLFAAAAEREAKLLPCDLLVRAHLHSQYIGRSHDHWFVSLPAWTLANPHAMSRMGVERAILLNDIGALVLVTDGRGHIGWEEYRYPAYRPERRIFALGASPARSRRAH